jgi:hypothetical protein
MPKTQTWNIYELVMSCGYITSTHLIRPGLHREQLFRLEKHRKIIPKMPCFHYLVDIWHPQSSCFLCRDMV